MKKSFIKQDSINVSILILISLCLGIFLVATTVVIAKDGTTFIEYAKKMAVSPSQTIFQEDQHPGYPALILAAGKITGLFYRGGQLFLFIYSAQAVALLFRILAVVILYFIGRELVGSRNAFWAILILILLPKPAEYGSDALSDWPYMFFLAVGMLLLFYGAKFGKWWMFALAGLTGGLGYLVRPEGAQVVIYGAWWLGLQLFWKKRTLRKSHAVPGLASMLFIFLIIVSPYMKLKGAIFPKKGVGTFSSVGPPISPNGGHAQAGSPRYEEFHTGIVPSKIAEAILKIFENTGDTLMWFFLLPYFIGIFLHFKKHKLPEPNQFFIIALIIVNVPLMIWLYCSHGYISERHTLPLVVFTMFFIPTGLNAWASWLNVKFSKGYQHTHRWFAILTTVGIVICIPKLLSSLHPDKLIYRQASQWLEQNTETDALIAVPDYRISFYAGRKGLDYKRHDISDEVRYIVATPEVEQNISAKTLLTSFAEKDGKRKLSIYRRD